MFVYADNAATTKVSEAALKAMLPYLTEQYGNPSSAYSFARVAAAAVKDARRTVAECIGAEPREIYFTSGGSEADNQAILSMAETGRRRGKMRIISTPFEHHAVLHTLDKLKKQGFEIIYLDVHSDGVVTPEELEPLLDDSTCLVTVMFANNEVGTVQPVAEIGALCRARKIPFHTDAVQAAGHMPIDVNAMNIDLLSMSGHKFHAPKGTGVLYARKNMPLFNLIEGGGQEQGKRAGTENVAGIAALAAALKESCDNMKADAEKTEVLRDRLISGISEIPGAHINGSLCCRVPGTVSVCFEGVTGEQLLIELDRAGICASAGSACTAGSGDPSHVLRAMGVPAKLARGALRLSVGEYNTPEEIEYILSVLPDMINRLREN